MTDQSLSSVSRFHPYMSPIEEIIEEAKAGRMFILIDDEGRENEGDLILPAVFANADAVNFMAKHARGLVCLAMTSERIKTLGLSMMTPRNGTRHETAFTVSIEAREGVTTGISAADRARTIAVAIDSAKSRHDIVSPGHVFPLMAREGGVLVRAGHTEAAVDIARLAGLNPSGMICEIMNDDGTMARTPELVAFAQHHGMKLGTIADLIAYRRRNNKLVTRTVETDLESAWGGKWRMMIYVNTTTYAEHVALVMGDIATKEPVLVRVHALNVLDDALGDRNGGKAGQLHAAMGIIAAEGRGVVLLIREPHATALSEQIKARLEGAPESASLRDYGVGAQILLDLGIREMVLLSNSHRPIVGLEGHGLKVVETREIPVGWGML
jgi:3,4-dihydroxy 2-butanone 4-phosphate synthase/GTP cyclohydrolase II